ncbi:hypothetical protein WM11_31520 [Burkholderia ubonensis]|uniref:hypothetical protein n=1 Tax=Burkholderia ubonensis TaxID=101571 RepID=UPI000756BDFD|nr:hypothetical protein [Burkholderia ubonensis]KVM66033.1 hypothetical protein WJ61_30680 [Burkholderia ubonensis]KVR46388.1 hypothetical protein WK18_12740 [Burkholderia ubonensis]KVU21229.1 hypothetical protein WK62_19795 [Burkholderia ubonensis]KWB74512.1 hypothetical protein WL41_15270 [Burkholderia ubonensis]KWC20044.1 hypothetical protein WL46_21970 [Burkholderia ubonensis]
MSNNSQDLGKFLRIPGVSRDCVISGRAIFGLSVDADHFEPEEFETALPLLMQMLREEYELARIRVAERRARAEVSHG